mmetsp:Transcript_6572/g.22512  ORF Transcript_6572/g.22512 Transcript_6572/m.22512 type:complete len:227 (+) Transcript_6572:2258-2938(+)
MKVERHLSMASTIINRSPNRASPGKWMRPRNVVDALTTQRAGRHVATAPVETPGREASHALGPGGVELHGTIRAFSLVLARHLLEHLRPWHGCAVGGHLWLHGPPAEEGEEHEREDHRGQGDEQAATHARQGRLCVAGLVEGDRPRARAPAALGSLRRVGRHPQPVDAHRGLEAGVRLRLPNVDGQGRRRAMPAWVLAQPFQEARFAPGQLRALGSWPGKLRGSHR